MKSKTLRREKVQRLLGLRDDVPCEDLVIPESVINFAAAKARVRPAHGTVTKAEWTSVLEDWDDSAS